ncbi:Enhancer of polycomb-like protein 1 [Agyrium rufum]|nr:Enhancer of polycomb-like protein 1 [Agyrium rufum]
MTRSTAAASARFRQRKLGTRQILQVLREDQVEKLDDEQARNVPKVETGVEKGEEIEHHLQAAIASQAAIATGKVSQIYIPTPETVQNDIQYDRLYPLTFSQPATYIRFSSTVEDCTGCPYNLNEEDLPCLKSINEKQQQHRNAATQCSEDHFEEVMNLFEETSHTKQPFAAVDNAPVLSWDEMNGAIPDDFDPVARTFTRPIYEHWKSRRLKNNNRILMPSLKVSLLALGDQFHRHRASQAHPLNIMIPPQFETGAETDDSDPYVCFRRREVRQARKTRGRDAQSVEKIRKLRKELEEARQLVALVRQREITKRESLSIDRQLFEQRTSLRHVKRDLPVKLQQGDEDLLINQKPQKKKVLEINTSQQPTGTVLGLPPRPDPRTATETDLTLYSDLLAEKENIIEREIKSKIEQHETWNKGYVDLTRAPITPPLSKEIMGTSFRTAMMEYLPTPPDSVSSEHENAGDVEMSLDGPAPGRMSSSSSPTRKKDEFSVAVRYASLSNENDSFPQPSFRRRIGRGGRLMIDRRNMFVRTEDAPALNERLVDRFAYDRDDDDEDDEVPLYAVDPYAVAHMRYRALQSLGTGRSVVQQQQAQQQQQQSQQQQTSASVSGSDRHRPLSPAMNGGSLYNISQNPHPGGLREIRKPEAGRA